MVPRRRPQVLGDRQQVAAGGPQVRHGLGDLMPLLAEPEDQVGLRDQPCLAGRAQYVERARVPEAGPDPPEDPRHGLDVVGEDFRPGVEDLRQPVGSALKSGMSSSTPQPGMAAWISRQTCAYSHAPPSARSSRATPVTVAYFRPMAATDSATRRGSPSSSGSGLPVSIWQKSHRRVHWSPPIRKVASRSSQHSKMFGQPASSQTVCRPSLWTRVLSSVYDGPCAEPGLDPRRLPLDRDLAVPGLEAEHAPSLGCEYHPFRVCQRLANGTAAGASGRGPASASGS